MLLKFSPSILVPRTVERPAFSLCHPQLQPARLPHPWDALSTSGNQPELRHRSASIFQTQCYLRQGAASQVALLPQVNSRLICDLACLVRAAYSPTGRPAVSYCDKLNLGLADLAPEPVTYGNDNGEC